MKDLSLLSPLGPGVYCADAFILTGNLELSGTGVWIFKSAQTLITSPGSSVTGGDPCNVWWRVASSATLDTTTSFIGNILAYANIELKTGATLDGRALAQIEAVNMDSNTITAPTCQGPTPTETTPTPTGTIPPPPVPELPTFLLMSTGILGLLGLVLMWQKRKD